jgi:beta-lactamase regulating signal transducer with metallopeptidase domain
VDTFVGGLLLVWGAGVAVALTTLVRDATVRRRWECPPRAAPVPRDGSTAVHDALRALAAQLGVGPQVRLVWGPAGVMPMTWGVRRPVILLPADAAAWPAPQRDAVLRHELAHVRRGDAGWALVAELACAVFWCHPGVWLARGARQRWQEHAADALAIASGAERHAYAAALVQAAQSLLRTRQRAHRTPTAAPAFAFHVGLAERLRVLTAPDFAPDPCTRRRRAGILAGAAATAIALAAVVASRDPGPTTLVGGVPSGVVPVRAHVTGTSAARRIAVIRPAALGRARRAPPPRTAATTPVEGHVAGVAHSRVEHASADAARGWRVDVRMEPIRMAPMRVDVRMAPMRVDVRMAPIPVAVRMPPVQSRVRMPPSAVHVPPLDMRM